MLGSRTNEATPVPRKDFERVGSRARRKRGRQTLRSRHRFAQSSTRPHPKNNFGHRRRDDRSTRTGTRRTSRQTLPATPTNCGRPHQLGVWGINGRIQPMRPWRSHTSCAPPVSRSRSKYFFPHKGLPNFFIAEALSAERECIFFCNYLNACSVSLDLSNEYSSTPKWETL